MGQQIRERRHRQMRQAAAIGLCLVLGTSSVALAIPSAAANAELVARAERLLSRGRVTQATVLFRRAYARAPNLTLALKLASALLPEPSEMLRIKPSAREQSNLNKRAQELVQLVDELPLAAAAEEQAALRDLWRRRAWAQAWLGDVPGAVASLRERGGRADADSARFLRGIAALSVQRDDLRAAEDALLVARSFSPDDEELTGDLAAVLLAQGRADGSIPYWEQRLRHNAQDLEARRDLAGAWLAAGHGAEALKLLEAERTACDAAKNCALEAARAALAQGEIETAIARLGGDFQGDFVEAQFLLADAHTRLGALERAREAYARILELKPGNIRARENLRALEGRPQETHGN